MLRINCAIWTMFLLTSLFLIKRQPKSLPAVEFGKKGKMHSDGVIQNNNMESNNHERTELNEIEIVEPNLSEAFQEYRPYYIWLMILLSSSYPYFVAANFKNYEEIDVHDDRFVTLVGALGAIVNGLSRGFWATLQDLFGFRKIFM